MLRFATLGLLELLASFLQVPENGKMRAQGRIEEAKLNEEVTKQRSKEAKESSLRSQEANVEANML